VRGDYGYNDLKDMNNKEGEQVQGNAEPINIRTENRRVQREAPKNKKDEKEEWGNDIENDLGL
jgi:hypothetical protein